MTWIDDSYFGVRRWVLLGNGGIIVAVVERGASGAWHWRVLRETALRDYEPTMAHAMAAAEAAWERYSAWTKGG